MPAPPTLRSGTNNLYQAAQQLRAQQQQWLPPAARTWAATSSDFTDAWLSDSNTYDTITLNQSTGSITVSGTGLNTGLNTTTGSAFGSTYAIQDINDVAALIGNYKVHDGEECRIDLPDGSWIEVKADGSYQIFDKDAKITYRAANIRDFNRYINVSDRIEEFIAFCGKNASVRKDEMLELPLKLFIGWLILEAAKADKVDDLPDVKLLPDLRRSVLPKCVSCGKFIPRIFKQKKLEFCNPICFDKRWKAIAA